MATCLKGVNPGMPFFSVILSAHNQAKDLRICLDSIFAQTDPNWELIVVEHGSTKETRQLLASCRATDKRIRMIDESPGNEVFALNRALLEVRGDWICWVDSDGFFDQRKLEIHRKAIEDNPNYSFFFSHFNQGDDCKEIVSDPPLRRMIPKKEWQLVEMLACPFINRYSVCVHRDALSKAGFFPRGFWFGHDYGLWLRLLALYPASYISERTCVTRRHSRQDRTGFPKESAVAAITFLNEHLFPELFPWTDLENPQAACEAVDRTLEIAAQPGAFLYALGVHPALLWRLAEWAWSNEGGQGNKQIQCLITRRAKFLRRVCQSVRLRFYFKMVSVACCLPIRKLVYQAISPEIVADCKNARAISPIDAETESSRRYLNNFEKSIPMGNPDECKNGSEIIMLCQKGQMIPYDPPYGALKATLSLAQHLLRNGHLVLLVGLSDQTMGFFHGVPFLGADDEESLKRAVKLLSPKDTAIGISRGDMLYMGWAERILIYHHGPHPVLEASVASLNKAAAPIVCVSEHSRREQLNYGVRSDLLHVVPNGFDHNVFIMSGDNERNLRSLIFAGHIVEYKGFDIALRAFEIVRREFPEATFDAYGQAISWQQSLQHQFEKDWLDAAGLPVWSTIERLVPGFRYCGEASAKELAEAFRRHSLLVLPARIGETFGIVLVEAQACGCIPVVPRQGAFPETLLEGTTGYLYDVNTSEHLAEFVIDLWRRGLPTEEQRASAQSWVHSTFSWDRSHAAFLEIMESTPARRGGIRVLPIHMLRLWEYGKRVVLRPLLQRMRSCRR